MLGKVATEAAAIRMYIVELIHRCMALLHLKLYGAYFASKIDIATSNIFAR